MYKIILSCLLGFSRILFCCEKQQDLNKAFIAAVCAGNTEEAQKLLLKGASSDTCDEEGVPAIFFAMSDVSDSAMFAFLLQTGASPNVRNKFGVTPLLQATAWNQLKYMAALLAAGADPDMIKIQEKI